MHVAASLVKLQHILGVSAAVNFSSILGVIDRAHSVRIRAGKVVVTGRKTRAVSVAANAPCIPYTSSLAKQAVDDLVAAGFQRHLCSVANRLGACKAPWRSAERAAIGKRSGPVAQTVAATVGRPESYQRLAERSRRGTWSGFNTQLELRLNNKAGPALGLALVALPPSATGLY